MLVEAPAPWPRGQARLQEHCAGITAFESRTVPEKQLPFLPHVSRGLLKRSEKLKQSSFSGLETPVLEEPVPVQRGIQRALQEMSFVRSSGK